MKSFILFLSVTTLVFAQYEEYFANSAWKQDSKEIIDFVKDIVPNPKIVLEMGMDFGCVIHCAQAYPTSMVQSVALKKGNWTLARSLGKKVFFSMLDTRILHEGKKPHYSLIIINGKPEHRLYDLSFAFKHSKYIIVSGCDENNVVAKKHLDAFMVKNKHIKILKYWPHASGTMLLTQ